MDSLTHLLHVFYTSTLPPPHRATLHKQLLDTLRDPNTLPPSITYIIHSTTHPPDALTLHFALSTVENAARTSFATTPPQLRSHILTSLTDFLISANARNADQTPPPVPQHALHKAATAAVQLGIREWIADSTHVFPRAILALIDQNGHTPDSLPRIFTGMELVTGLVDAAIATSRTDLRSAHLATLTRLVRGIADGIVAALEIGIRINGPRFPKHVAVNAVRAVAGLVRIEPKVGEEAVEVLKRCVQGRCDRLGAETLGVLAELFGEGKVKIQTDWQAALAHAAAVMEPVAMGEVCRGEAEELVEYRARLVAYAEAVVRRVIALGARGGALERVLNALMGVTVRWASESPAEFVAALDAWTGVLEGVEDAELEEDLLLERVYGAVSDLCVRRCMMGTNSEVLGLMEGGVELREDEEELDGVFEWDQSAAVMAEVASDPVGLSTILFMGPDGADNGVPLVDVDDDFSTCRRAAYVGKCVETLLACTRMSPERVGGAVADFACKVLREKGQVLFTGAGRKEDVEDLCTAAYVAYCITPLFPAESPKVQALFEVACELVKARVWRNDVALGVIALRTAASLTRVLALAPEDSVRNIGSSLILAAQEVMVSKKCAKMLVSAASLLVLSLDQHCRPVLFATAPPIDVETISSTGHHSVAALGVASMMRWSIVPTKDPKTSLPVKWSPEEWNSRQRAFQKMCESVFGGFVEACNLGVDIGSPDPIRMIARGSGLLKTMVMSTFSAHGNTGDVLWQSVGKAMSIECLKALSSLRAQVNTDKSKLDDDAKRIVCGVMGCVVSAIASLLEACRRQVAADAGRLAGETVDIVLSVAGAQGNIRLGRAALNLIRDQLASGGSQLLGPGIELSVQTLERGGDQDLAVAAVGVLTESLKGHWQEFWPGDVVQNAVTQGNGVQTSAPEPVRRLFFHAIQGLLCALRSKDLSVCRSALLALQTLDAARRIYARRAAFRDTGAAHSTVLECVRILGADGDAGRESLGDEAVEVVFGVAKVDFEGFYGVTLPTVIREIGDVSDEQGRELADGFGKVSDRNAFVRSLVKFANDFAYSRRLNSGPSL